VNRERSPLFPEGKSIEVERCTLKDVSGSPKGAKALWNNVFAQDNRGGTIPRREEGRLVGVKRRKQ